MGTPTAYDLARTRMTRLSTAGLPAGESALFGNGGCSTAAIEGHHAFNAVLVTVEAGQAVELEAMQTDRILFVLSGSSRVTQGEVSTECSRWDCLALSAAVPVNIAAKPGSAARFLHLSAEPAAYTAAGRQPVVTGAFDDKRVARWGHVRGYDDAFVTSSTPGLEKRVFKLLNRGISAGAHVVPALPHEYPFTLSIVEMEAGKGATLHSHATEEIFVALDGHLDLFWGPEGEGRMRMAEGEMISIPVGLMRGFRNENGRQFHMLAIVGGWNRESVESVTYNASAYTLVQPGAALPA
jgi:mannose-6-phosphate isomerase-like protein (cupin superfamily)